MSPDRWQDVKQKIYDSFKVLDAYEEELDPGVAEVIEFQGPGGDMKICFNTQPRVVDKKTLYSHRAGGNVQVDYTYSNDEEVCFMTVYKKSEGSAEWEQINASAIF